MSRKFCRCSHESQWLEKEEAFMFVAQGPKLLSRVREWRMVLEWPVKWRNRTWTAAGKRRKALHKAKVQAGLDHVLKLSVSVRVDTHHSGLPIVQETKMSWQTPGLKETVFSVGDCSYWRKNKMIKFRSFVINAPAEHSLCWFRFDTRTSLSMRTKHPCFDAVTQNIPTYSWWGSLTGTKSTKDNSAGMCWLTCCDRQ